MSTDVKDQIPVPADPAVYRRISLVFALLGIVIVLLGINLLAAGSCVGLIAALLAPLVAAIALVIPPVPWRRWAGDASIALLARRVGRPLRIGAVLLFVTTFVMCGLPVGAARRCGMSAGNGYSVRSLMSAIHAYHDGHGAYPDALIDLLSTGIATPDQLVCRPWDRAGKDDVLDDGYSSYAYYRGVGVWREDPAIILVHERLAWSYGRPRWDCQRGYSVGFADGTVRWLDVGEMTEALHENARRRAEIGWPTQPAPNVPATRPAEGN